MGYGQESKWDGRTTSSLYLLRYQVDVGGVVGFQVEATAERINKHFEADLCHAIDGLLETACLNVRGVEKDRGGWEMEISAPENGAVFGTVLFVPQLDLTKIPKMGTVFGSRLMKADTIICLSRARW